MIPRRNFPENYPSRSNPSMFRVLQFNMQFGMGWNAASPDDAPIDIEATIAEIKKHSPDIVLLQEVEHAHDGGVQIEPPPNYTRIKEAMEGYDSWFSYPKADPRELPFGIGLAIFRTHAAAREIPDRRPVAGHRVRVRRQEDDADGPPA